MFRPVCSLTDSFVKQTNRPALKLAGALTGLDNTVDAPGNKS